VRQEDKGFELGEDDDGKEGSSSSDHWSKEAGFGRKVLELRGDLVKENELLVTVGKWMLR